MGTEDSLIGCTLGGRFEVVGYLGSGGMGTVYRGVVVGEPGEVAIKVLSAELAEDPVFLRRFHREARTAARLRHRSTVRIVDHGIDAGRPYIVMELVAGADLHTILEREGRMSELRAARLMAQVCSALAAAHDLGVVHRDLKPENIMVAPDPENPSIERVKVLDFGIAKIMAPELCSPEALPVSSPSPPSSDPPDLTRVGSLVGTPSYMAPEQFRGVAVDARTDLYACGLLLHQLITDQIPLVGDSWSVTAALRQSSVAPRPSALVPSTHEGLDDLVASALDPDPAARPQSARQMQEQLLALLAELEDDILPARIAHNASPRRQGLLQAAGPASPASRARRSGRRGLLVATLPPDSSDPSSNQDKLHDRASWLAALPAVMRDAQPPSVQVLDEDPTRVMVVGVPPRIIEVNVPPRPSRPSSAPRWMLGGAVLALLFVAVALLAYWL